MFSRKLSVFLFILTYIESLCFHWFVDLPEAFACFSHAWCEIRDFSPETFPVWNFDFVNLTIFNAPYRPGHSALQHVHQTFADVAQFLPPEFRHLLRGKVVESFRSHPGAHGHEFHPGGEEVVGPAVGPGEAEGEVFRGGEKRCARRRLHGQNRRYVHDRAAATAVRFAHVPERGFGAVAQADYVDIDHS